MSFARIATLRVSGHSYDLMYFRYGFWRETDKKGRPSTGINGGTIVLAMESTKSTELLERFLNTDPGYPTNHPPRTISGSVEVCDPEDGMVIRKLVFEEAFLVQSGEQMHTDSPLPMMETITISPLRLDIDRTIRLDRHWPQTSGGWQEFVQEEQPRPVSFMESIIAKVENEKNQATAHPDPPETFDKGGKYGHIPNPKDAGAGKKTTSSQRKKLLEENKKQNNGELRSDGDGRKLNHPSRNVKGQKADMNQAEIDHIDPKSKGGSNKNSNLQVISKEENLKKSNK